MSTSKVTFGEGTLYEAMPNWKPLSSEKSKLKAGFDQLQKDLSTVKFHDEMQRKAAQKSIASAWREVTNPGWGGALNDLNDAIEAEMDGRGLMDREDTATWELYLAVMEVLVGLTERLARGDGRWYVRSQIVDRVNEMRQNGLSKADLGDTFFNAEYPWTERFNRAQMARVFKAAQGGFIEGVGMVSDALVKMKKKAK